MKSIEGYIGHNRVWLPFIDRVAQQYTPKLVNTWVKKWDTESMNSAPLNYVSIREVAP